ncbi:MULTISPECIES: flavodoxin domain-containing protein [Pseudothermotoga]|jgi:menaquinone-dependent protoporphyrinogen oxidase|uniref:flavodoxin domain-containing protein n=1 Tax=Pseudothermotoga TaxID=1643951 RepID=UPI00074956EE|nr:MAG: Flavodoxin-like protein [Pseudothermotoga lettingae]MDI3495246.1 menaquinone-dependent protoporphyrinogen oxidase [Pseudothermotoga sp.]MDK2885138.1 menaquinone-dependent protoporphyrinogen oxidase [Pseudothermotoga sp.]
MIVKVLVAYDTYTGTTEKCAKILAEKFKEARIINLAKGYGVVLNEYDCVVVGSYVHAGKISKRVKKFCEKNIENLRGKKIGIFLCMLGEEKDFEEYVSRNFSSQFLDLVKAKDYFGGELNYERMNFVFRFILKLIVKNTKPKLGVREEKIENFAKQLMD